MEKWDLLKEHVKLVIQKTLRKTYHESGTTINNFSNFFCAFKEISHLSIKSKPVLDYVLSQAKDNEYPYISLSIYSLK